MEEAQQTVLKFANLIEEKISTLKLQVKNVAWDNLVDAIRDFEDNYGPIKIYDLCGDCYYLGNYATYGQVGQIEIHEEEQM